jgi:hypothetical protein
MSRKNPSVGNQHGNSRNSQLHMHMTEREKKYQLWAEMMKRKEEASKPEQESKPKAGRPKLQTGLLDKYFEKKSNHRAQGLACYIVASRLTTSDEIGQVADRYGLANGTLYNYVKAKHGLYKLPKHIIKMKKSLDEDLAKSSVTVKEIRRLLSLSHSSLGDLGYESSFKGNEKPPEDVIEDEAFIEEYDHMLNDEQKVELMDLANLELAEVKPITKSDVVVGVIVGAVVGASMAAYLFITNGAI